MNKLYVSRFRYEFGLFYANSLSIWRIHSEFTWSFAKLPWIHYYFRELAICLRNYHEGTIYFADSQRIYYLYRDFTIYFSNSLEIHFMFHEFTIYFAYIWWLYYQFREFTMNLLLFREFTIYFANPSWIYLVFREVTINSLSLTRI